MAHYSNQLGGGPRRRRTPRFLSPRPWDFHHVASQLPPACSSRRIAPHQRFRAGSSQGPQSPGGRAAEALLNRSESWIELCNGKDLAGWHGDEQGYEVQDGVLICKKGGKNLITDRTFGDFAVRFEFKLEESGNNGLGIRVPDGGHPSRDGLEIQILDHDGARYTAEAATGDGGTRKLSWLKPWQYHGSIYGVYPAHTGYLRPAGQWNTETIIAIEDHILVILNGAVIVDAFLDDCTPLDGHEHPGMRRREGHLVLAGHNDRVEFRDLKAIDFSPSPPRPKSTTDNTPPTGFDSLFNGKDLDGWKGLRAYQRQPATRLAGRCVDRRTTDRRSADQGSLVGQERRADLRWKRTEPLHGAGLRRL